MTRVADLELLVRAAELGSLTAAARALDWSPAAASAAVKRMEAEWGVPPPRVHLTRFHGVFAAHAALRAAITPAGRGAGAGGRVAAPPRLVSKEARMGWARRLKRVFGIEIEQCVRCGGRLTVIASIEEPELIERILAHRREQGGEETLTVALGARAPPQARLF